MKLGIAAGGGIGGDKLDPFMKPFLECFPEQGIIRTTITLGDNWNNTDDLVDECKKTNSQLILTCGYSGNDIYRTDANDFTNFSIAVVDRYGVFPLGYEFGNEMNHLLVSDNPDPVKYTEMHKTWYTTCKDNNSDVQLFTSGLGGEINKGGGVAMYDFLSVCFKQGLVGYYDALALHPYGYPLTPTEDIKSGTRGWSAMNKIRLLAKQNGDNNRFVHITEFGAPTHNITEAKQAMIMADAIKRATNQDWIKSFCIFSLVDNNKPNLPNTSNDNDFGLVYYNGKKKKSWSIVHNAVLAALTAEG